MSPRQRDEFDALVEEQIAALPAHLRALLDEVPVIVEDEPSDEVLASLGMTRDEAHELCGLHTGVAFTEQTVEASGELPAEIMLYREGIVAEAGGWDVNTGHEASDRESRDTQTHDEDADNAAEDIGPGGIEAIREQIRITLLHEIGHQFGLDEDDLDRLGYA